MRVHDRRQQHERVVRAADFRRHLDHSRHHARGLHDRHARIASEGVVPGQLDDEVQALVDHLRERVRRIEPDRRQQRTDLALEVLVPPTRAAPRCARRDAGRDARRGEPGDDLLVEHAVHLRHQRLRNLTDLGEARPQLMKRRADERRLQAQLLAQPRDADLEEFVEVAADDA